MSNIIDDRERLICMIEAMSYADIIGSSHPGMMMYPVIFNRMLFEIEDVGERRAKQVASLRLRTFWALNSLEISKLNRNNILKRMII